MAVIAQQPQRISEVCWRDTSRHNQPLYIVPVSTSAYHQYRHSPSSLPLVSVVDSFDLFISQNGGGNQGRLDRPSQQQLWESFGKREVGECIEWVLREGVERPLHGNSIIANDRATKHFGRG